MIISYQWLMEYLPEPLPVNELSRILTSIGLEVEAVEPVQSIPGGLEGLIIGEVLTCRKHPNADKLSITTVSLGGPEALQIVCGAPNVAAGQHVVVAPVGASVHPVEGAPFLIKKVKIRGEESNGMICAEDEIGLGKSHAGIMVLPESAPVGMPANEYFNIPKTDYAIHIGLTPNRSDANSHVGVARDVCAYLTHHTGDRKIVRMPEAPSPAVGKSIVKVRIEAPQACPRYAGIYLENITVGASPEWLQQRLNTIGVRSINNIVDITNFVLHEYGQPLHAFDADRIHGKEINVRFVPKGTAFITLDEKTRTLQDYDLMICDAQEPLAIGGVFGGLHSGITEATKNAFLESAYFSPTYIRRTSLHHGLRTDAATHFEKGVDISNVVPAMVRAAQMIAEIAGGKITGITDEYPAPLKPVSVTVSYEYIRKLSGKHYQRMEVQELLIAAGFEIETETDDTLTLKVPSNKPDVLQPADIVEEIVRIDGLDNIAIPERLNISLTKGLPDDRGIREHVSELLCGMGLQEIVTNSIVNSKYYPGRQDLVRMLNSLSSELDVMRPSMMESGLEVIQHNCNRKNNDLALFELGNIYLQFEGKYFQYPHLAIWISGNVRATHWQQKEQAASIYYLEGLINNLFSYGGIKNAACSFGDDEIMSKWKNQPLCAARKVPAQKLKEFDIKQDVYFAEVYWETWLKARAQHKIVYKEVPRFPAVQRDLAMVLDKQVSYSQVQDATEQLKLEALQSFGLFDVFESDKLGAGKKSYALSYTFQLQDRTLTDAETEQLMKRLIEAYKSKLNAQIRE